MSESSAHNEIRLSLPKGRIELVTPQHPEDDPERHAFFTHPAVTEYLPFLANLTVEDLKSRRESRITDPHYMDFCIHHLPPHTPESTGLPRVLGAIGYIKVSAENDSGEGGIIVHPDAHRLGIASEGFFLLLDFGFKPVSEGGCGFNRIAFTTAAKNTAMRGWMEMLGASQEATYRQAWRVGEKYIDAVGYAILRQEWIEGGARERLKVKVDAILEKPFTIKVP